MKRIFIDSRQGLCNRLEIFALAYALHQAFGHEIVLGWPELDALQVKDTRRGYPGFWGRLGAVRVRHCSSRLFAELAHRPKVILRGFAGPPERIAAVYQEAASKLELYPSFRERVRSFFETVGRRPVVGVHLRGADFSLASEDLFDLSLYSPLSSEPTYCRVPIWWHEWVMDRIVRRAPNVCFLVCYNGSSENVARLRRNFDVVEIGQPNPYLAKGRRRFAYGAQNHPVTDLFALACCRVVLATPVSSYSHYACNVLGAPSACLVPPPRMVREAPCVVRVNIHGHPLPAWWDATLFGQGVEPLEDDFLGIEFDEPPHLEWLAGD